MNCRQAPQNYQTYWIHQMYQIHLTQTHWTYQTHWTHQTHPTHWTNMSQKMEILCEGAVFCMHDS